MWFLLILSEWGALTGVLDLASTEQGRKGG